MHLLKPCLKRRTKGMKKIKHIKDIEREKLRLRVQQLEQEKQLRESWKKMKDELNPINILRSKTASFNPTSGEKGIISDMTEAAVVYLSERVKSYTGERTAEIIRSGLAKLTGRLQEKMHRKRKAT